LHQVDSITADPHLRLVWPQWQGAGTESVRSLAPEFPFDIARRGYSVGTKVLQAVLPEHDGPTAIVPVEMGDIGLEEHDGIEAKAVVLQQLRSALAIISEHEPARITTVGGECSVSIAPFSYLIVAVARPLECVGRDTGSRVAFLSSRPGAWRGCRGPSVCQASSAVSWWTS